MDLLCKAYSNTSDDEPEPEPVSHHRLPSRPPKRPKPEYPSPALNLQKREEAPLPGRYISKRERALFVSVPQADEPNPNQRDHRLINATVLSVEKAWQGESAVTFSSPTAKSFAFPVVGGQTMELAISQFWSSGMGSHETTIVDFEIVFHGIGVNRTELVLDGSESTHKN